MACFEQTWTTVYICKSVHEADLESTREPWATNLFHVSMKRIRAVRCGPSGLNDDSLCVRLYALMLTV